MEYKYPNGKPIPKFKFVGILNEMLLTQNQKGYIHFEEQDDKTFKLLFSTDKPIEEPYYKLTHKKLIKILLY